MTDPNGILKILNFVEIVPFHHINLNNSISFLKMKLIVKILILFVFIGYESHAQVSSPRLIPTWFMESFENLELDQTYSIGAFLKPIFLEADFNGDGNVDVTTALLRKDNLKHGLLIIFKDSSQFYVFGAGIHFGPGGDNFDWADFWEINNDSLTHETTFLSNGDIDESREIVLENPAISIREDEGSGGLIYFNGNEFIWIHQGD
jgi:hypothetical protein